MSNILIVGNIIKDVYLRLDERLNNFEIDEHNVPWLDLGFNGSTYNFFNRISIYGGAAVTLEVLNRISPVLNLVLLVERLSLTVSSHNAIAIFFATATRFLIFARMIAPRLSGPCRRVQWNGFMSTARPA